MRRAFLAGYAAAPAAQGDAEPYYCEDCGKSLGDDPEDGVTLEDERLRCEACAYVVENAEAPGRSTISCPAQGNAEPAMWGIVLQDGSRELVTEAWRADVARKEGLNVTAFYTAPRPASDDARDAELWSACTAHGWQIEAVSAGMWCVNQLGGIKCFGHGSTPTAAILDAISRQAAGGAS